MTKKIILNPKQRREIKELYLGNYSLNSIGKIYKMSKQTVKKQLLIEGVTLKVYQRTKKGHFTRKHNIWTPQNQNDGWVDVHGRFMVYLPSFHKINKNGYARRSWVHYEYFNNVTIPDEGYDIHHKDKNRLNDSKENLELIEHSKHTKLHNPLIFIKRICKSCGKLFKIKPCILNDGLHTGNYCSTKCRENRIQSKEEIKKRRKSLMINRWSRKFDNCVLCGKTDYKHVGNGLCKYCYQVEYKKRKKVEK